MALKVSFDTLYAAVCNVLRHSSTYKDGCLQTVELQIGLKNYNPSKEKRFSGNVLLNLIARPQLKVCVLGDQRHCDEAKFIGVDCFDTETLKVQGNDRKFVKKLAKTYDVILVSAALVKVIPKLLGAGLTNVGKFPIPLTHQESVRSKIDDLSTNKSKLKKILCLSVNVGHVGMQKAKLTQNISQSIHFLVPLLKENWQNVRSLHIRSSMGPLQRIY
ncbi:hypothetical protein KR009_009232 [Drosophila setifemur]|nr:hypothetical protein KR009_009232 [Drosophila setifemur]